MKAFYQVETILTSINGRKCAIPSDIIDIMSEQVCSSLQITEIIERLSLLGYQARYEPRSHIQNKIASIWVKIGEEEHLLNCQMELVAMH